MGNTLEAEEMRRYKMPWWIRGSVWEVGQRLEDSQRYNTKNDLPPQLLNIFGLLLDLHYKYVLNRSICMCAFICSYLTQSLSSTIINPFQSLVGCVGSIPEK